MCCLLIVCTVLHSVVIEKLKKSIRNSIFESKSSWRSRQSVIHKRPTPHSYIELDGTTPVNPSGLFNFFSAGRLSVFT